MDKNVYLTPDDLEIDRYEFWFTCPYCGNEMQGTSYSICFHEKFQCPSCEKLVDVYCDV